MTGSLRAVRQLAEPVRRVMRSDLLRHGALVFAGTMTANIANYLFNFLLSRNLGVDGFAALSALVSTVMILSIPGTVLTLVVVKYAAIFHATGDWGRIRRLALLVVRWCVLAGVVVMAAGAAGHAAIANFLRIPNDGAVLAGMTIIAFGFILPALRGVLQGQQQFLPYSTSLVLESVLKVVCAAALAYAGFGVTGAMLGWVAGSAIALFYTVFAVFREKRAAGVSDIPVGLDLRRVFRTTVGIALATACLTIVSFLDVLLVKHYFSPYEAGLYAAVNLSGKIILFLVGFVPTIVLPKAVVKAQRGEDAIPLLAQSGLMIAGLCGVTLTIFGIFPRQVLAAIAGHAFAGAAPYVLQYDTAMALLAFVTLLVNYRIALHHFSFLYFLPFVLAAEVVAIAFRHGSLEDVVHIVLAANALALLTCLYRIAMPSGRGLSDRDRIRHAPD